MILKLKQSHLGLFVGLVVLEPRCLHTHLLLLSTVSYFLQRCFPMDMQSHNSREEMTTFAVFYLLLVVKIAKVNAKAGCGFWLMSGIDN